jgi:hypothetical protein
MTNPSLTITNEKASEVEFEIAIQGIPAHEAKVRFVIEGDKHDTAINCERTSGSKWLAHIPAIPLNESNKSFRVEVIAGNYYFCPTRGGINLVNTPKVRIAEVFHSNAEPMVTVSARFKQTEPERQLIIVESLSDSNYRSFIQHCESAHKIFERVSAVMKKILRENNVTSKSIVEVIEAAKKAVKLVEAKLYD